MSTGRGLYAEEPISEEKQDQFSRSVYADVIAETITGSEGGFNFGISGEWGAGKSSILKLLEPRLRQKGSIVIWFNPWRVASEKVSIRRKFLFNLVGGLRKAGLKISLPENLERPTIRIVQPSVKKRAGAAVDAFVSFAIWFGLIGLVPLGGLWLFDQWALQRGSMIPSLFAQYKDLIAIPAIVALVPSVREYLASLRIEQTNPEIETAIQFEEAFAGIVSEAQRQKGGSLNLVIFIDDLDRCPPADIMTVFSSLMTFFDRKGITFVISADQRMVENIMKGDLGGNPVDAHEFLKKIFQVNWIIPPIPYHMQREFVKRSLPTIVCPVDKIEDPLAPEWIVDMVEKEFGSNPRKVRYFFRELEFQIRAVEARILQLDHSSKAPLSIELENLTNVRRHPELLAKVLLLRASDRWRQEWDLIMNDPSRIIRLEGGQADSPFGVFLTSKPKFSEAKQDPQYYIFFSGITGFERKQLADPSFFVEYAKKGDLEKAQSTIRGALDIYRVSHLDKIIQAFDASTQPQEKINYSKTVCRCLQFVEDNANRERLTLRFLETAKKTHAQQPFLNQLDASDYSGIVSGLYNHSESIQQAGKMLRESPFANSDVKWQVFRGFSQAPSSVPSEIIEVFAEEVLSALQTQDAGTMNQILGNLSPQSLSVTRSKRCPMILDKLIEIMSVRDVPSDPLPYQTLGIYGSFLSSSQKAKVLDGLRRFFTGGNPTHLNYLIQTFNILQAITPAESFDLLTEGLSRIGYPERERLVSFFGSQQQLLTDGLKRKLVGALFVGTPTSNAEEARRALTFVRSNNWIFPDDRELRRGALEEFLDIAARKPAGVWFEYWKWLADSSNLWKDDSVFRLKLADLVEKFKGDNEVLPFARAIQSKLSETESIGKSPP